MDKLIDFIVDGAQASTIKVIGVGGGGGNAVKHMYAEGIHNVSFILCNTDQQALKGSDIPIKVLLGPTVTKGLGAGNKPLKAYKAAEESIETIKEMLSDGTEMVFITAGMGGGTGTGASPLIAKTAMEMGILTVGIATIPFEFEGRKKKIQAIRGVEALRKQVDALLVINNERLRDIYSDYTLTNAFKKADETLSIAARGISDIVTIEGNINLDFNDVNSTLKGGGISVMSTGYAKGVGRVSLAIDNALTSPLLNNNDIFNAKRILLYSHMSHEHQLTIEEMSEFSDFMDKFNENIDLIWGYAFDNTLGEEFKITILASGFDRYAINDDATEEDEQIDSLLAEYYGHGLVSSAASSRTKPIVLTLEQMDEEQIISMLEENPPYKRKSITVAEIKQQMNNTQQS